ncbi:MAG: transcriptional regulator NrdR [Deltaproteobacteria bacterium]|nr:transcriptional regulator NrdR [Deltaproteobacteria bacterium]
MKCPYCGKMENRVMDSRYREGGNVIRRRRKCEVCSRRFTTYERVGDMHPMVVKKDGRRETFDRAKIMAGVKRACEKLPVSVEQMEQLVDEVERHFCDIGEKEVESGAVGDMVIRKLHDLHKVAYVRFASVYRSFKEPEDFLAELKTILNDSPQPSAKASLKRRKP